MRDFFSELGVDEVDAVLVAAAGEGGVEPDLDDFEGKLDYSEWRFMRPNEPDPNGDSLRKGLVSGGVLGGDEGRSPVAPEPDPVPSQNPISSGGLR